MQDFSVVILACSALTCLVIVFGTLMSYAYRKKPIVKSTIPVINVPVDIVYAGMVAFVTQESIQHETPCFVYLWIPFLFVFCIGNSYTLKCWRLYVLATTGMLKDMEFIAHKNYAPELPNSVAEKHLITVDIDEDGQNTQSKDFVPRNACGFGCDKWVHSHRWIGGLGFLWKLFIIATLVELTIPLSFQFLHPQYRSPLKVCTERTPQELVVFFSILGFFALIYLITLVKLRRHKDWYGLKRQLLMSAVAWLVVLVLLVPVAIYRQKHPKDETGHRVMAILSVLCWLLPFSADTLWPLFRALQNANMIKRGDIDDVILGLEGIIGWKDPQLGETGWTALAEFLYEHCSPADVEDNVFLIHGIFFIRDFLAHREELTRYSGWEILKNQNDQLDKELCGLVVISWMKYLHKKGEYVWPNVEDVDAIFSIERTSVEGVKKDLEIALKKMAETESFDDLTEEQQSAAGKKLREIYGNVLQETEKAVLHAFRRSIQFETFWESVKGGHMR